MRIFTLIISIAILAFLFAGCSGPQETVSPSPGNLKASVTSLPVGVSAYDSNGNPSEGMGSMGLFQLHLDPVNASAEISSLRQGALTDVLETVDITNFLSMAPCHDCVKVKSVALDNDGNLVVSIGIKHPFIAGDPMKPISGQNRADLHVFNVEGIVISNATAVQFPGLQASIADFRLMNADGYTGYLDGVIDTFYATGASIHPYITHFDDYSSGNFDAANPNGFANVTNPGPSGNLVMPMGCDYDFQNYVFDLTSPVDFIYAIGCTYAVSSASKNQRFNPEYRIPQHNKKAASEVSSAVISNGLAGERTDSTAEIEIRVVDISHGVAVGDALNQMLSNSSVDSISVEIPAIMTSMLVIDGGTPISGTGHDPSNPLVYRGTVTNTAGALEGTYPGLIKVKDTYAPGQNVAPLLNGLDGIQRVNPTQNPLEGLFPIIEFATYQTFSIYVMPGNDPPVAVLKSNPDPPIINQYTTIDLDGTASSDPDGTIALYEFDFQWDGVQSNFTADASNVTGIVTTSEYDTAGTFTIGLRVTDNEGATGYDSISLEVQEGCIIFVDDDNTMGPWDGSQAHPYRYVQDGVDAATNDCIVWIKPGRYNEDLGGDPWTSDDAEVTIANLTNLTLHGEGSPVINCHRFYGPPWPSGIYASNCPGLKIEGIEISLNYHNTAYVRLATCDGAIIQDCTGYPSTDMPSGGAHSFVNAVGSANLLIKNNTYVDSTNSSTSSNHLAYLGNCNNAVITLNTCTNNANATNSYQTFASWLTISGSSNVVVSKNIFGHHHKIAGATVYQDLRGIHISGGSNNVIRNNLIYDLYFHNSITTAESRNWAIRVTTSTGIQIYNNTIDSFGPNNTAGIGYTYGISLEGNNGTPQIYSNILSNIYANANSSCYGVYADSSATQEFSNVWNLTGDALYRYRYGGAAIEGTGCIQADPQYTDPAGFDFTLQAGSPCKGTGKNGDDMGCYGGPDPLP